MFVSIKGSSSSNFRRALKTGNWKIIEPAALELPYIWLDDALQMLVFMARENDDRYPRAAAKLAARITTERHLDLAESRFVLALTEALPRSPGAIAGMLEPYCARR